MMAVSDDIGTYLTNAGVVGGTTGWRLAIDWMPPRPDRVVTVTQTGGYASAAKVGLDYPTVQVRIRATSRADVEAGAAKADAIYLALDHAGPTTINGISYRDIQAEQYPAAIGEDENRRPEWSVNFRCLKSR